MKSKADARSSYEQRLAAKLRDNLKRRKQQARARAGGAAPGDDTAAAPDEPAAGQGALKPPGDSDS